MQTALHSQAALTGRLPRIRVVYCTCTMEWKKNKKILSAGWRDLEYLPPGKCDWNHTLAALSFGCRKDLQGGKANLNEWATRHGVPASSRYASLGEDAIVLWHGTSRERAEKITSHGLFHKRGLWTTLSPSTAHGYCRRRSTSFDTDGAMVCIVVDPAEIEEGVDYNVEVPGNVYRFHHGLPKKCVEYILLGDQIQFTGISHVPAPSPWMRCRCHRKGGRWVPIRQIPIRFSEGQEFSSIDEFVLLCISRLLKQCGIITAVEVFSILYALLRPERVLSHVQIFALLETIALPLKRDGRWLTYQLKDGKLKTEDHPGSR